MEDNGFGVGYTTTVPPLHPLSSCIKAARCTLECRDTLDGEGSKGKTHIIGDWNIPYIWTTVKILSYAKVQRVLHNNNKRI